MNDGKLTPGFIKVGSPVWAPASTPRGKFTKWRETNKTCLLSGKEVKTNHKQFGSSLQMQIWENPSIPWKRSERRFVCNLNVLELPQKIAEDSVFRVALWVGFNGVAD